MEIETFTKNRVMTARALPRLLILISLVVVAYYPVFDAGFIMDDEAFYIKDPIMAASNGLSRIWLNPLENNKIWAYVPISRTSFWLERQLWGLDLSVSHKINVIFHLFSALLLWGALQHFKIRGAWLIGMLFALHPVHVQSVAWIAERRNVVAAIFYISSLWSYLCFEQKQKERWYWLALGLFLGALLSKTSTIMLPVVLIFCRIWFRAGWKRADVVRLLPFFLLSLGLGVLRIWFETHSIGAKGPEYDFSFLQRILIAGHVPFFYLKKFVLPYPLIFNYPKWNIDPAQISLYFPIISQGTIVGILLWKYRYWGREIFLSLIIFGSALFPVLGFFNIAWTQFSFVTDHWVYLPGITILILSITGIIQLSDRLSLKIGKMNRPVMVVFYSALFLILGGLTWNQTRIYKNMNVFWQQTLAKNPSSWLAHYNLGKHYLDEKQYLLAIEHFSEALNYNDRMMDAYLNRGDAFAELKVYDRAIENFNQALKLHPEYTYAYSNRGLVYSHLKQYHRAIQDFNKALQIDPKPEFYTYRGYAYVQLGKCPLAVQDFNRAIEIGLDSPEPYNYRGLCYANHFQDIKATCSDWVIACQHGDCRYYQMARQQGKCQ